MQSIPNIGSLLAERYYVEDILDTCGETAILKCLDTRLEVGCVIKLLIGDDEAPDWSVRREHFIDAFRKQARLNHPNIVHVVNIELRGERTFAVMESVEGFTLARYLENASFNAKEVTELFLSMVDAVSMAHGGNVLHKGITPRNIMLYQQDNRLSPRILNFGAFRDSSLLNPVTQLPYLPPEQLRNYDNAYPASDVYGLCASMFFAFTHKPPYLCEDYSQYLELFASNKRELEFPDEIPAEFVELLRIGLSVVPQQRFPNANALLKALKKIGGGFQLSANLTIEASRSYPNLAAVTPSQPFAQTTGGFTSIPPLSTLTPSQPIVPRVPSGTFSQSQAQAIAINSQPHSSASQSILAPEMPENETDGAADNIQAIPADCQLPPEIASIYRIERIDSVLPHAIVGSAYTLDHPDLTFGFKMLRYTGSLERAVFAEGVRRSDVLSKSNEYFEKIFDSYPEHGIYFISNVDHVSLKDYLDGDGAFPVRTAVHVAILLAHAMNFAHQNGFVNGNIKPTNILFEELDGRQAPIIYDFGQRLYVSDVGQLNSSDLPYVAPELGYNLQLSNAQADIYAFGIVLIEMLIGRSLYQSTDFVDLLNEIGECSEVPNTDNWQENLPKPLLQVIRWCTNFDTSHRYMHFSDLIRDLYLVHERLKG